MKIGITGGIGSGKTFVCKRLQEKGFPIYLCDDNAKRLMKEDEGIRQQLKALIGDDAYTREGLNKAVIAQYLFRNKENAGRINGIVHPAVMRDMEEWYGRLEGRMCFIESAILFEAGLEKMMDKTVLVYADEETRLRRAMERDGTTEEKVKERMAQQLPVRELVKKVDYVLRNNGEEDMEVEIENMIEAITKPSYKGQKL